MDRSGPVCDATQLGSWYAASHKEQQGTPRAWDWARREIGSSFIQTL